MIQYIVFIALLIVLLILLIWWWLRGKPRVPRIGVAVCTLPDFETATYVGSLALKHVVDEWRDRGFEITDLHGDDAVRTRVLDALAAADPVFFFGVGHGNADVFTGQGYDKIFWTCDCGELAGRVAYMLSCVTAARLGPDAVSKGAACYIGYADTFGWIMEKVQDPLVDRYARGFFEAALEIIRRLTGGASTAEAFRASIDVWNHWIDYWAKSPDPNAPWVLQWLLHDRDCQKLIGDEAARVASAIPWPWWLAMTLGFAPFAVVGGVVATEEARKAGVLI